MIFCWAWKADTFWDRFVWFLYPVVHRELCDRDINLQNPTTVGIIEMNLAIREIVERYVESKNKTFR